MKGNEAQIKFNEDSRVKIPALVHLTRLGYNYVSIKGRIDIDEETNIFLDLFKEGINKINSEVFLDEEVKNFLNKIKIQLENDDMGKAFYKSLMGSFPCKLIDFDNFENNIFTVVTELPYKNGEDNFRPDIIVLINGIPLSFIEVKIPNNSQGVLRERKRINTRFANKKFKKFMNLTQLMVFSNNNEYDEDPTIPPIQGAFYASPDKQDVKFNYFREEDRNIFSKVPNIDEEVEKFILKDNNLISILNSKEFETNKKVTTPTNKILTSLFSLDRLRVFLKYGIAFVSSIDNSQTRIEKHVMRYPQFFATLAIEKSLNSGIKKGIIWHTQGSGKTALSYFNVRYLKDYFQKQNKIAKFYFVTDRIDLTNQARNEFTNRDLEVEVIDSKEAFIKNIQSTVGSSSKLGKENITVLNIHKFSKESVSKKSDYDLNVQRIYFLDEVHRSYNPKGSFLSNLISSDRDAIIIGLTGTPIISKEYKSKDIFGDYIHKYYYNKSISDGYTLKLIREEIETSFKEGVRDILRDLKVQKGGKGKEKEIFAHKRYVKPLTEYILNDFKRSKVVTGDDSIGAMVVCHSSEQAKEVFAQINDIIGNKSFVSESSSAYSYSNQSLVAEDRSSYGNKSLTSALILHDVDDKDTRKDNQNWFKEGKIDILVVYQMLLTGFDAKRLKKLYLNRVVKKHNLLQTLTRVNRPYNQFKYGYVVDFANIQDEFEKTNQEYFEELRDEVGDEMEHYSNLFKSSEEIAQEILEIEDKLFSYDLTNFEEFEKSINLISNKKELLDLRKCFENLKALYNNIVLMDFAELKDKYPFENVKKLLGIVNRKISIMNFKDNLNNDFESKQILNEAIEDLDFNFKKIGEHEMVIADQFKEQLSKTWKEMNKNFDQKAPEYIALLDELKRVFKKKGIEEFNTSEIEQANEIFLNIFQKVRDLNNKNETLAKKYDGDVKFARLHKRIRDSGLNVIKSNKILSDILNQLKNMTDDNLSKNSNLINNSDYFLKQLKKDILLSLKENGIKNISLVKFISENLIEEYLNERLV